MRDLASGLSLRGNNLYHTLVIDDLFNEAYKMDFGAIGWPI